MTRLEQNIGVDEQRVWRRDLAQRAIGRFAKTERGFVSKREHRRVERWEVRRHFGGIVDDNDSGGRAQVDVKGTQHSQTRAHVIVHGGRERQVMKSFRHASASA